MSPEGTTETNNSTDQSAEISTYAVALTYSRRGMVVTPVHGMSAADPVVCACHSGPGCLHPGKHPMLNGWQRGAVLSDADCYSLFAEPDPRTGAMRNIGLVTGRASGVWALDEDPRNGGRESLAAIEAKYGPLPPTLAHSTGSGGRHFLFLMPPFPLSSGQWPKGNGPLGPGVDVKADGGQIVLPGSVTNHGRYAILRAAEVLPTPAWLADLLRAPVVSGAVGLGAAPVAELPWHDDLPEVERKRLQDYAVAGCKAALESYTGAAPGTGSFELYKSSISMIELAQSPWNLVSIDQVYAALERARAQRVAAHPHGGGQSPMELRRTWDSALARTSGRGRPVPAHPDAGVRLALPFSTGPVIEADTTDGAAKVFSEARTAPGEPTDGTALDLTALRKEGVLSGPVEGAGGWAAVGAPTRSTRAARPACPDVEETVAELDGIREVEGRRAYLRALIPKLIGCDAGEVLAWRDVCCADSGTGGLRKGEFDTLLREARKEAAAAEELAGELARRKANAAAVAAARERGSLLPGPYAPLAVARELVRRWPSTAGLPHAAWWQGEFYQWHGTRWSALADSMMRQQLYLATEHAQFEGKDGELSAWCPRRASIGDVEKALAEAVLQRPADQLDDRVIACLNGVYDLRTDTLTAHYPAVFNLTCLPYAYDPVATCSTWLRFLGEVLPGDQGSIDFLQEWFGYIISGRTDLQKIADLVGPPRSGKGTIARTLRLLVGPETVAEPSLSSLAVHFGLQPLIGKTLAIMPDVNWNVKDVAEASEVIKKISGEDSPDVPRKGREDWHGQLGVRFMIMGNDLPRFNDPSGALVNRMIHVPFQRTFLGAEDSTLGARLGAELPGILNWALDGLRRLEERGRFLVHDSSREAAGEIVRHTSAVSGFMEDHLAIANPDAPPILLDYVYAAFRRWCEREEGRDRVPVKSTFSRDLQSAGRGSILIKRERNGAGKDGPRQRWVYGVAPAYLGALDPPIGQSSDWLIG